MENNMENNMEKKMEKAVEKTAESGGIDAKEGNDIKEVNGAKELFPYEQKRNYQDGMLNAVSDAVSSGKHLIIHAPTGIGKTAAVLAPALKKAIESNMTVFYLTGRHTQHQIAISTLKEIRNRHNIEVAASDLIGRASMCPIAGAAKSRDFNDYCRKMREDYKCNYYVNTKKRGGAGGAFTVAAEAFMSELKAGSPEHVEKVMQLCNENEICAYEMSVGLAAKSTVIIADYYHLFDEGIRTALLNKTGKRLDNSIIIVDEAHNLPKRARELMTSRLTSIMADRALKEAKKFGYENVIPVIMGIKRILEELSESGFESDSSSGKSYGKISSRTISRTGEAERLVPKDEFSKKLSACLEEHGKDFDSTISEMDYAAEDIRERNKISYIGSISNFLQAWQGPDEGFARILSQVMLDSEKLTILSYRCLDPSIVTKPVLEDAYSVIMMSATLAPTIMYQNIMGFGEKKTSAKEYRSPFPKKNKINIVVPETTTQYKRRNTEQFQRIAEICADIVNKVPGNSALFFPSYSFRDNVHVFFNNKCKKTIFLENSVLTKEEKSAMLDNFKSYKSRTGAVILGVASGNFSEGIDLPGILSCVVVIGIPLNPPDLETRELIDYYEKKFSKGFEYGYIFPAMNRCIQSAGRCIRSETDRGVLIFLDERFAWNNYMKYFPGDWEIKVTRNYSALLENFFRPIS